MNATALATLTGVVGEDLLKLGRAAGTIARGQDTLDKGWANRTLVKALPEVRGLDVRLVPLRKNSRTGELRPKHALALASIDSDELVDTPFEESKLFEALADIWLVAREDETAPRARRRSKVLGLAHFSLLPGSFAFRQVRADYELVQRTVRAGRPLTGDLGQLVQPRTKGQGGDAPRSFAFYARTGFISQMLGL